MYYDHKYTQWLVFFGLKSALYGRKRGVKKLIRKVRMGDTDATGAIYFTSLLRFAVEAFEEALEAKGLQIQSAPFLLPIVHAEADFIAPIALGDVLDISFVQKNGSSSISVKYEFCRNGTLIATASIVHVAIERKTGKKVAVSSELKL